MSNPAVITLAETQTSLGFFRIEDNIGESVHLHLGEFREDLTIDEFSDFTNGLENAVEEIVNVKGFTLSDYSLEFISRLANTLPDLKSVTVDEVYLEDMIVDAKGIFGIKTKKKLKHSRVIKALTGNTFENDNCNERNYFNQSSQERLDAVLRSIKENGYPANNKMIVMFNKSNEILDGQHRAACMYYLYGNKKVPVRRMHFRNGKYTDRVNPYIARLYRWDKERVRRLARNVYRRIKKIKYIIEEKCISMLVRMDWKKNG